MVVSCGGPVVRALSPEQKKIFDREINYYDLDPCGGAATPVSTVAPGSGTPTGAIFPNLPPVAMASAIDTYIQQTNPSSKLSGHGGTIVDGAQNSNINPFLLVAIAQNESSLANPGDNNVQKGNNAFGRSATASQPHFDGGGAIPYWYKWTSMKASVDHTAAENQNANGGGDMAAYIRSQYGSAIDAGDMQGFVEAYVSEGAEGNAAYLSEATAIMDKMAQIAQAGGGGSSARASTEAEDPGLREKIGQMMFVGATNNKQEMIDVVRKYKVGGVMLTNESTSLYSKSAISEIKAAAGDTPLLIASDEEGGSVQRLKGQTGAYPNAKTLGGMTTEQVEKSAKEYGDKLAELGVTVNYAPVVDIDNGSNSVISGNNRAFSGDEAKITEKAGAFAAGMRSAGLTPVFKHFPGHGRADGDSHTAVVKTPNISSLRSSDLVPYKTLMKKGESGVMMGHLVVPGLTEGRAHEQTSINERAYALLRDEFSFDGVVFTDEIANMRAIVDKYSPPQAVSLAIQAGADMPLFNKNSSFGSLDEQVKATIDRVEKDVNDGNISQANIEKSTKRISKLKSSTSQTATSTEPINAACCSAGSSSTVLTGNGNEEQIWNYLITEMGFNDTQAAGIMGNIEQESGFDPEAAYVGPESDAYGIIQWVGPRRAALEAYAASKGKDKSDLGIQLEYMKKELESSGYKSTVLDPIKASTNIAEATRIWLEKFEVPCLPGAGQAACFDREMNIRLPNATTWLNRFGGGTAGTGSAAPAADPSAGGCGSGAGGSGGSDSVSSGTKAELIQKALNHPKIVYGNYGPAADQKDDVQNCLTETALAGLVSMAEHSGVKLPINAMATDHGGCSGGDSLHNSGRAIDIGYYGNGDSRHTADGDKLYSYLYRNRQALKIDELIWKYPPSGQKCVNNLQPTDCDTTYGGVIDDHNHHIHVGFK